MSFNGRVQTELGLLPKDWNVKVLGEELYIKGRIGWKGLKKNEYFEKSEYRIINGSNIINNKIDWSNCGYISKERYDESPEIMLQKNDIVMTKDGTIGKVAKIDKLEMQTTVASGLFVIRNQSEIIDTNYLFYYFISHYFKGLIKSRTEGSVIPHLYQRDFVSMKIPLPRIEEQKSIANLLSSIDHKIELNNEMNQTLEEMAQTIFKSWFVDFEFPNDDGVPYKSSGGKFVKSDFGLIPEYWEVSRIEDFCDVTSSKRVFLKDYVNEGVPFFRSKEIIELSKGHSISTELYISNNLYDEIKSKYGVPIQGDILLTSVGTLGVPYLVGNEKFYFKDGNLTWFRNFKTKGLNLYLHRWLLSKDGKNNLDSITIGSTQKALTISALKGIKFLLPNDKVIDIFTNLFQPLNKKIEENILQNNTLIYTRDYLLPKLMSGEIQVNNALQEVESCLQKSN
jgi:type I restriction enzyme, S subunit